MRDDDRGTSARRQRKSRGRSGSRPEPRVRRSTAARPAPTAPTAPPPDAVDTEDGAAAPIVSAGAVTAASGGSTRVSMSVLAGVPGRADLVRVAVDAALRGALAMFAGFAATVALGLLLWAITPGADLGAEPAVRAATAAYVLAHFGHVGIDGSSLTLSPLLLPLLFGLLLALGPGRSRAFGASVVDEAVAVAVGAVSYAALVVVAAVTLAPPGVGVLGAAVGALVIAGTALGLGTVRRGPRLRELIAERLPVWATAGITAGGAATLAVVAGAGLVFVVALILEFTTAADLASTLSAGGGDAVGLALAGLAYLPNAVLATVGYVTGVGFGIGTGRYSPLGSVPADLPPFPLLAAVPSSTGMSAPGLATLLVPVAAGLVAAVAVQRRVGGRHDRLRAVGIAAVVAGLLGGLLVWAGTGGVSGGPWPQMGAVGWQVGPVLALVVLVVAGVWVLAAARSAVGAAGDGRANDSVAASAAGIGEAEHTGDDAGDQDPGDQDPDRHERDDVDADGGDAASHGADGSDPDDSDPDGGDPDGGDAASGDADGGDPDDSGTADGVPEVSDHADDQDPATDGDAGNAQDADDQDADAQDAAEQAGADQGAHEQAGHEQAGGERGGEQDPAERTVDGTGEDERDDGTGVGRDADSELVGDVGAAAHAAAPLAGDGLDGVPDSDPNHPNHPNHPDHGDDPAIPSSDPGATTPETAGPARAAPPETDHDPDEHRSGT